MGQREDYTFTHAFPSMRIFVLRSRRCAEGGREGMVMSGSGSGSLHPSCPYHTTSAAVRGWLSHAWLVSSDAWFLVHWPRDVMPSIDKR